MCGFYGAYNCYGRVRMASGFIYVSVSASGTSRVLDCWIFKGVIKPGPKTRANTAKYMVTVLLVEAETHTNSTITGFVGRLTRGSQSTVASPPR